MFRYPVNPSQDFIKRVVGVGGDVVEYRDKQLTVNGKPLPQRADGSYSYLEGLRFETTERRIEQAQADGRPARVHDRGQSAGAAGHAGRRAAVPGPRELRLQ